MNNKHLSGKKIRYCLGVSQFTINLFDCMHIGRGDTLRNWPFSQLSDLHDLDLGLGHVAYHRVALIDLYPHSKFCSKNLCGQTMDNETDFVTSSRSSRPSQAKSTSYVLEKNKRSNCLLLV